MPSAAPADLPAAIDQLERFYGPPPAPFPGTAFELVLFENVAYLADDARRREAFAELERTVGTRPEPILAASDGRLLAVARRGILPGTFAAKLREAARIAFEEFGGDLDAALSGSPAAAKKALRRFPGIGEPAAEKILLTTGRAASLAPDSNALRVLVRLGWVEEAKAYAATYRAAVNLGEEQLGQDLEALLRAHQLLRRHGQELCKRSAPLCERCPLAGVCATGLRSRESA